jgi:hypothetical protein
MPTVNFPGARGPEAKVSYRRDLEPRRSPRPPTIRQRAVVTVTEVLPGWGRTTLLAGAGSREAAYEGINNRAVGPVP